MPGKRVRPTRRGFGLAAIAGAAAAVLGSATYVAGRGFRPSGARGAGSALKDVAFDTTARPDYVPVTSAPSLVNGTLATANSVIAGTNTATGAGVYGKAGGAPGVYGTANSGYGVAGLSALSNGVQGTSSGSAAGVYGTSHTGPGVQGQTASAGPGVYAVNSSTGPGLTAISGHGRGAVFTGTGVAQIQLTPGGSTHPASGAAGDFYVDHSARLWFCKGGTTWKQVA
ncbi:MAG TPA: hypothetical protein VH478_03975 [Trebonia sp.]|nr:hypothetical protein [Trebonia sp.]